MFYSEYIAKDSNDGFWMFLGQLAQKPLSDFHVGMYWIWSILIWVELNIVISMLEI